MIRAVVDTNVLVSALLSRSGNEALVLLAVHQGFVRPCLSAPILDEYRRVLTRPRFGFAAADIEAVLTMVRQRGDLADPATSPFTSPDADDSKFLHCAVAAGADCIITGNRRHFPDAPYGSIQVMSAAELMDRITREI